MNSQELNELLQNNINNFEQQVKEEQVQQPNFDVQQHSVDAQMVMPMPRHLNSIPNLDTVQTNYDFDVCIPSDQSNNVVFSQQKLFIKMGSRMNINLSYREQQRGEELFLRAMIIFSKPAEMHLPVKRCANHRTPPNQDARAMASIIKVNDPKATYFGEEVGQTFQDRLSVVIPIENLNYDENGKVTQSVGLEFLCQNSCSSGINRKPASIVFTLENNNFHLLGKSAIEFKVCSCPKRDAEREKEPKPKQESNLPFPRGKRPRYSCPQPIIKPEPESESDSSNEHSANENTAFSLTTVTVKMPTELVPEFLKDGFNLVAGKMAEDRNRLPNIDHYEKCLKDIRKLRKRFEHWLIDEWQMARFHFILRFLHSFSPFTRLYRMLLGISHRAYAIFHKNQYKTTQMTLYIFFFLKNVNTPHPTRCLFFISQLWKLVKFFFLVFLIKKRNLVDVCMPFKLTRNKSFAPWTKIAQRMRAPKFKFKWLDALYFT